MKRYFKALTGFRAIAAFMVYLCHFNPVPILFSSSQLKSFFSSFNTGVTLFFVLSGFLIVYRYIDSFQYNKTYIKQYFINRFARIYPVYFIFTTLNLLYTLRHPDFGAAPGINIWVKYILNITFLRGFFEPLRFSLLGQGWSLTVEECFYISAPIIIYFFIKFRKNFAKILLFSIIFSSGIVLFGILLVVIIHGQPLGFFDNIQFLLNATFFGHIFEFILGAILAFIIKNKYISINKIGGNITYVSILLLVVGIELIALFRTHYGVSVTQEGPLAVLTNNVLLPFPICGIIYGLISENTLVSRFFSSKIMELLGKSSYVFYLIHIGIIRSEIDLRINIPQRMEYFFILFILIIMSVFIYKYIEEPLNNKIRSIGRKQTNSIYAETKI